MGMHREESGTSEDRSLCGASLRGLPNELFSTVAKDLTPNDLLNLRAIGNHSIRNGIDHAFAKRMFTTRVCKTTNASIAHLDAVTESRFARNISTILFDFYVECQTTETEFWDPDSDREPCVDMSVDLETLCSTLTTLLKRTPNLKSLTIKAPNRACSTMAGISDGHLGITVQMSDRQPQMAIFRALPNSSGGAHGHFMNLTSAHTAFQSIMIAMRHADLQLDEFNITDFAMSRWQSLLADTTPILTTLLDLPSVRSLTRLTLEFDIRTNIPKRNIGSIVRLIENNANLQRLKLSTLPARRRIIWGIYEDTWSPLLDLLGSNPPFRLHTLDLDGLNTTNATTLDRIVHVHSNTIRRIILENTSFRAPNSFRAFFASMAATDIEYLAIKDFMLHDRSWIRGSTLSYRFLPDEELTWFGEVGNTGRELDQSYVGWTDIIWETYDCAEWLVYNNEDGQRDKGWMKSRLLNVVEMVDCGGIRD